MSYENNKIVLNSSTEIINSENREISIENPYLQNIHFIERFLATRKSKYTADAYRNDIEEFFRVKDVSEITIEQIQKVTIFDAAAWIETLKREPGKKTDTYLSASSINRKVSSLASLYNWILKYRDNNTGTSVIKYNPFANLKEEKPTINSEETEFLTKEETRRLLNSIKTDTIIGLRNKLIFSIAFSTALRKSEILNIRVKDITTIMGYNVIKVIQKRNKQDAKKIQPQVKALIDEYLIGTNRNYEKNAEDYLFLNHSNNSDGTAYKPLSASSLNQIIEACKNKIGIRKHLRVHSTRHTAITLAIDAGATVNKVAELAGHTNIQTTMRYVHSVDKLKNNAGDLIDIF